MGLDLDLGDSTSSKNHKSFGTRFGLKFDPMAYFLDLFGSAGDKYRDFINSTGDKFNEWGSDIIKPINKLVPLLVELPLLPQPLEPLPLLQVKVLIGRGQCKKLAARCSSKRSRKMKWQRSSR
jgi:hypothetical protein